MGGYSQQQSSAAERGSMDGNGEDRESLGASFNGARGKERAEGMAIVNGWRDWGDGFQVSRFESTCVGLGGREFRCRYFRYQSTETQFYAAISSIST
jgi:hypothetical protein